jgi:hypothetical protein
MNSGRSKGFTGWKTCRVHIYRVFPRTAPSHSFVVVWKFKLASEKQQHKHVLL